MRRIVPISTEYKGYKFRSRLEVRWAVFFDACGVDWEYEPEGFNLGDGLYYLPDFLLHGLEGRCSGNLYVEVKRQMTDKDAQKIWRFCGYGPEYTGLIGKKSNTGVLVVGRIPDGEDMGGICSYIDAVGYESECHGECRWPAFFNFETIDGDWYAAHPGVNTHGRFELFGNDSGCLAFMDDEVTFSAYLQARQARFEHGEKPVVDVGRLRRLC